MRKSSWRYYVINQLLVGGDLESLPNEAVAVIEEEGLTVSGIISSLSKLNNPSIDDPVVCTFLNHLRVPDYAMAKLSDEKVVTMNMLADVVRQHDGNPDDYSVWAQKSIVSVEVGERSQPAIKDGSLFIDSSYMSGQYDLVGAMNLAFSLYCWGAVNPPTATKNFVNLCSTYVNPKENLNMSCGVIKKFLDASEAAGCVPSWMSKTVFYVHDLSKSIGQIKNIAWWSSAEHKEVTALLPKGKDNVLAPVNVEAIEFVAIASGESGAANMVVKGDKIVLEEKSA